MKKTHIVWYTVCLICLTFIVGCGSVRHNQMVASERDRYESLWRKCQYEWLMCTTKNGNIIVNAGVIADSLQKAIWNRDGMIDSLKLELKNLNYEFTRHKVCQSNQNTRQKDW